MFVLRPVRVFENVPGSADVVGPVVDVRSCANIRLQVGATGGGGSPANGSFELYMSDDHAGVEDDRRLGTEGPDAGSSRWTKINVPPGAVHGSGYTAFVTPADAVGWDGTQNLN